MSSIIVRNVPEDLHRLMKATAAMRGQTLNAFLIACAEKEIKKDKSGTPLRRDT